MSEHKSITELARELRNNPTPAERKFWKLLRRRQMLGLKFLRQKPIVYFQKKGKTFFFIADFYCAEKKLVIEVDGKYHTPGAQETYDHNRDLVIQQLGLSTLRIRNDELEDLEQVKEKILAHLR